MPNLQTSGTIPLKPIMHFLLLTLVALLALYLPHTAYCEKDDKGELIERLKEKLKDETSRVRSDAVEALRETRDPRAVEPLVAVLRDNDSGVRKEAARALGEIKDPRAVEPLIKTLRDENSDVQQQAAWALGEIGGSRAKEALLEWLNACDLAIVAENYHPFIQNGIPGSVPVLIDALNECGGKDMAQDFLNCGNSQLKQAARAWATEHGYTIIPGSPSGPRWGER